MMKRALLLFLCLGALVLAACDGGGGNAGAEKTADRVHTTANDTSLRPLTVSQGGRVIEPYRNFLWASTYTENGWLAADGLGAFYLLPEIAEQLPSVQQDATLAFHPPADATVHAIDLFDADYQRIYHNISLQEFYDINGNMTGGTYYVSALVVYTGEFFEQENRHNRYGYEFLFKMTVGNTLPEQTLRWEVEPPLYHIAMVRVDGWKENSRLFSPEVTVIASYDEMNAFRPDADFSHQNFSAFRELIKQYGPSMFEGGDKLFAIHITDSTGSANYTVGSVEIADEEIKVRMRRDCPEAFTTNEAQWLIFVELERGVDKGQSVNVDLTGV